MGTIVERPRKNRSTAYMAKIILKREGVVVHRETETFERRAAAASWISRREEELAKPGALDRAKAAKNDPPLSEVIGRYIDESEKAIGRTKAQCLRTIQADDLGSKVCSAVDTEVICDFAKALDCAPSTRGNYLSHLQSVFTVARPMWKYPLDPRSMADAQVVLRKLGIISKSNERDRRPTLPELDRLMTHFQHRERRRPKSAPMCRLIAFAIFSTRRQEEISRIAWVDLDEENSRVLVRDMKNPGDKIGNHVWCDLPEPALRIIQAMPRTGDRIFPYGAGAMSAAFTRACDFLTIEDLRFHDLRHDGVSRLFEMGLNIPHAAAVSGHRSWTSLKRYTHVRQRGDKYAGWEWLAPVFENYRPLAHDQDRSDDGDDEGETDDAIGHG